MICVFLSYGRGGKYRLFGKLGANPLGYLNASTKGPSWGGLCGNAVDK